ncbi:MAG: FAD-binding oxidoreductase [Chloroflexi bacterium]|nr:MAG: FAD-binding oxidoreductase [Chloroflexota bacterium]
MTASDVIIIGGGINGCSVAFFLAQAGLKVTLVERDFIASGPTGRSSAIIRQHYSNEVTARMALRSLRIWQNFADVVGGDAGFVQTGILLGASEEQLPALKANIEMQKRVGIDTRFLTPEEVREVEPAASVEGLAGAAYEPEAGHADPAAAAMAFAEGARSAGATLMLNTRATGLQAAGGKITGVETDRGSLSAGAVVIAAGPWTPYLTRTIGLDLPITASRHEVAAYRRPPTFTRHMIFADFTLDFYLRPETGGLMLVGSIEDVDDQVDPDNYDERIAFDTIAAFAERVTRRYPAMENGESAGGWASLYDITPDWHHIMGALPGVDGLYCVAGGSGHGFKLAPAVGEMMRDLIVHGPSPEADINLFSFERFSQNRLITGQYEQSIVG